MVEQHLTIEKVAARRLREERRRQGLTQDDLASRCVDLGEPIARTTIAKIENGKRALSLSDVFVLAAALNTSPAMLFLPIGDEDDVYIAPKLKVHPHLAMKWIEGTEPLPISNISQWHEAVEPLRLYRDFRLLQREMQRTGQRVSSAEYAGDEARITETRTEHAEAMQQIAEHMERMVRRGVRPAELHSEVLDDMRRIGIEPWTEDRNSK